MKFTLLLFILLTFITSQNCFAQNGCESSYKFINSNNQSVSLVASGGNGIADLFNSTGFTWEAWIYLDSISDSGQFIATEDATLFVDIFFGLGGSSFGGAPDKLFFQVDNNSSITPTYANVYGNTSITLNQWHHVACVCDYGDVNGNGGNLKIYLDGVLDGLSTINLALADRMNANIATTIGNINSSNILSINGSIDEVMFWNSVRTQTEISIDKNGYCTAPFSPGLVAYFKANELSGSNAYSSINGNFTGINSAQWGAQSPPACITNNNQPFILPVDTMICLGDTVFAPQITKGIYSISPNSYSYNSDSLTVFFTPKVTTTYTIISPYPCGGLDTVYFTIHVVNPVAQFSINPSPPTLKTNNITLINQSTEATIFNWYENNSLKSTNHDFSFLNPGIGNHCYTLVAINTLGCSDTITHCFNIEDTLESSIFIPNAFSPNGDTKNDVIRVLGKNIKLSIFKIYNRWGQQVFETNDILKGWNGKFDGEHCEIGVYFYFVKYIDIKGEEHFMKGDISLLR